MAATRLYLTGVTLSQQAIALLEQRLDRDSVFGKYLLSIKLKAALG